MYVSGTTTQGVTGMLEALPLFSTATVNIRMRKRSQPVITCLKLTIEALEQGMKYIQS